MSERPGGEGARGPGGPDTVSDPAARDPAARPPVAWFAWPARPSSSAPSWTVPSWTTPSWPAIPAWSAPSALPWLLGWPFPWAAPARASVREGRAADAEALAPLHAASFARGWSAREFEDLLAQRAVVAHVAARPGAAPEGFALSRVAADEAEVLSIAVDATARRRGIARALLGPHLAALSARGARRLFLEVEEGNLAARALYAAHGFREVGRRRTYHPRAGAAPADALVLRRELD